MPPPAVDPLAAARRGEAIGIAALYQAHAGHLLRAAWRITGSRADAEDVVHDLFVALPTLLARYEEQDRLDAWLRGIAVRRATALVRRERRRTGLLARFLPVALGGAPPSCHARDGDHALDHVPWAPGAGSGDPQDDAYGASPSATGMIGGNGGRDALDAAALERAVATLPSSLRVVLVLRHYEELPYDAIALHLGITAGAARVRLSRALARLRTLLPEDPR